MEAETYLKSSSDSDSDVTQESGHETDSNRKLFTLDEDLEPYIKTLIGDKFELAMKTWWEKNSKKVSVDYVEKEDKRVEYGSAEKIMSDVVAEAERDWKQFFDEIIVVEDVKPREVKTDPVSKGAAELRNMRQRRLECPEEMGMEEWDRMLSLACKEAKYRALHVSSDLEKEKEELSRLQQLEDESPSSLDMTDWYYLDLLNRRDVERCKKANQPFDESLSKIQSRPFNILKNAIKTKKTVKKGKESVKYKRDPSMKEEVVTCVRALKANLKISPALKNFLKLQSYVQKLDSNETAHEGMYWTMKSVQMHPQSIHKVKLAGKTHISKRLVTGKPNITVITDEVQNAEVPLTKPEEFRERLNSLHET